MHRVAETRFYRVAIDAAKNRMYLGIFGFWGSPEDVPDFHADLKRAADLLSSGFTILTDATEMRPHAQSLLPVHEEAQRLLLAAGLDRTAELVPSAVTKLQVRRISDASGMRKATFTSSEEAEAWLDGPDR